MTIINLTPHIINHNDGRAFPPSGTIARVETSYSEPDERGVAKIVFGDVVNLPAPKDDVLYIVSGLVSAAVPERFDVVSPATNHPKCVRNEAGHVVSVPCWVK